MAKKEEKAKGLPMEQVEKRLAFEKLVATRVSKVLRQITLIGNLANKSQYDYETSDVEKIVNALNQAVDGVKQRFQSGGKEINSFKL